jgi:hypothetical protein
VSGFDSLGNEKVRTFARYTHSLQVNATKERSSHSFKFGGSGELALINNVDRFSGNFYFGRGFTSCDPADGGLCIAQEASDISGNSVASLLLGVGGGDAPMNPDKAMALRTYGLFFQDTWRASRRLTLTLGLRWEAQRPATERFNRLAYFDPNVVSPLNGQVPLGREIVGGFRYASADNRFAWPADNTDLAPRVGLAYRLTDRLVMRAGAGIFYAPASAMISFDDPGQFIGFSTNTTWAGSVGGAGLVPAATLSNPFPNGKNQPTGSSAGLLTGVGEGISQVWPWAPHPTGYKSHFSVDFQYELANRAVLEAGYTGWRGRKLMYGQPAFNPNQLPTQFLSLGNRLDDMVPNPFYGVIESGNLSDEMVPYHRLLRPFPHFDWMNYARSLPGAQADFDSLNLKFNYQATSGFSILSTYQYSRVKDNGGEDYLGWGLGAQFRDTYNTRLEYGVSSHDMPHSFVNALVYELPVGAGKKFGGSLPKPAEQVVGGWQVSGIVRMNSGVPMTPVFVGWENLLGQYGFGYYAPDLVGNPKLSNRTAERWVDESAFAEPKPFTLGNAPQFNADMRESPTQNVDLSLAKNFKAEAFRIQFRADFLNLFNTPQFGGGNNWGGNIDSCLTCGQFGKVIGVRNLPRNIQLGLRLEYDD